MTALALAPPIADRYEVTYSPSVTLELADVSPAIASSIRRRLEEIAEVAGGLASIVADGVGSTLRLEISGYLASYTVSDVRRRLTVLSMVRSSSIT